MQSVSNDTDPPVVSFVINSRVEVDDSITVNATDPGGIQTVIAAEATTPKTIQRQMGRITSITCSKMHRTGGRGSKDS